MNEYEKIGRQFAIGFIREIIKFILLVSIAGMLLSFLRPADSTDVSRWNRSQLKIYTDAKTGIEYLGTINGGLIKRGKTNE